MEKQISIQCQFTNEEELQKILQKSFDLYLARILTEQQGFEG